MQGRRIRRPDQCRLIKIRKAILIRWLDGLVAREGLAANRLPNATALRLIRRGGLRVTILVGSSEINMKAQAGDGDGAAVLVIAGIVDVLDVEGSKEAAPDMRGVKALKDFLRAVSKGAVS